MGQGEVAVWSWAESGGRGEGWFDRQGVQGMALDRVGGEAWGCAQAAGWEHGHGYEHCSPGHLVVLLGKGAVRGALLKLVHRQLDGGAVRAHHVGVGQVGACRWGRGLG